MPKISIKVRTENYGTLVSDPDEFNEAEIETIDRILKDACTGKAAYFSFTIKNEKVYFPTEVLKTSIISIITYKNT